MIKIIQKLFFLVQFLIKELSIDKNAYLFLKSYDIFQRKILDSTYDWI